MSGIVCSSLGMMSATLAEAVAHVDQPWETVIGYCMSGIVSYAATGRRG
jgi:hypothetical protein